MRTLPAIGRVDHVEPYHTKTLARKERLMGFGHQVYAELCATQVFLQRGSMVTPLEVDVRQLCAGAGAS
jgi:hypothetical protein